MLYEEFLNGTKAKETPRTYEQYKTIEKIYNDCESVTKEDAYKFWKQTYGKQEKKERERLLKEIQAMSEYRDTDEEFTPERQKIRRLLFQTGVSLTDTNEFNAGYNAEITTPDGVTYRIEKYGEINFHKQYRMVIKFEGKTYGTALIYSFGNLRIHATPENLPEIA